MPKQPNEEERQEIPEAETDSSTETVKAGLAVILTAIAIICGLIGTWAAATSHYTTLSVAIIVGIISVGLAAWLGWPPKKIARRTTDLLNKVALFLQGSQPSPPEAKLIEADTQAQPIPFEVEHDRLAKEVVRLRIENERLLERRRHNEYETTKLEHNSSVDETENLAPALKRREARPDIEASQPFKPFTDPKTGAVHTIPFSTGYGNLWMEYTQDEFDGVIWQWQYNPEFGQTARNLTAFCIECRQPMRMSRVEHGNQTHPGYRRDLDCRLHKWHRIPTDSSGDFVGIKARIQQKLRDDTWIEVVNRQRLAISQAPISGPVKIESALPEISTLILRVLARNGGSCDKYEFQNGLSYLCSSEKKSYPDEVSIQFYLHELEQQGYLSFQLNQRLPKTRYALTQRGRRYVIDHKLVTAN